MKSIIIFGAVIIILVLAAGSYFLMSARPSETMSQSDSIISQAPVVTATSTSSKTYSLADVSSHKDATSCWTAIDSKVYDLTEWINQHPGGSEKILQICGIDGSSAFNNQHGGESRPANELESYYIGDLIAQ